MYFEIGVPVLETSMVALTVRAWDGAVRVDANKQRRSSPEKEEDLLGSPDFLNKLIICTSQIYPS
jgi:hypothetical protein